MKDRRECKRECDRAEDEATNGFNSQRYQTVKKGRKREEKEGGESTGRKYNERHKAAL